MFGYLSAYKGHLDALDAVRLLPPNFKLLIFGRQHPQTLKTGGKVDEYLKSLQKKVLQDGIADRVFFMGELAHEDFLAAAAAFAAGTTAAMMAPTRAAGAPMADTPASMLGASAFASSTTTTRHATSSSALTRMRAAVFLRVAVRRAQIYAAGASCW